MSNNSERSAVRGHLNDMLNRLFVEHQKLNDMTISNEQVSIAYEARWEILNELEEFLGDAVVELAP